MRQSRRQGKSTDNSRSKARQASSRKHPKTKMFIGGKPPKKMRHIQAKV